MGKVRGSSEETRQLELYLPLTTFVTSELISFTKDTELLLFLFFDTAFFKAVRAAFTLRDMV